MLGGFAGRIAGNIFQRAGSPGLGRAGRMRVIIAHMAVLTAAALVLNLTPRTREFAVEKVPLILNYIPSFPIPF